MLLSQRSGPSFKRKRPIVSKRSSPEKTMSETATEKYEEIKDSELVLYTRTVPVISGTEMTWFDVEVYLSKGFLKFAKPDDIKTYLDRAVAAILTRNGCTSQ